jgi:hypothetical protein
LARATPQGVRSLGGARRPIPVTANRALAGAWPFRVLKTSIDARNPSSGCSTRDGRGSKTEGDCGRACAAHFATRQHCRIVSPSDSNRLVGRKGKRRRRLKKEKEARVGAIPRPTGIPKRPAFHTASWVLRLFLLHDHVVMVVHHHDMVMMVVVVMHDDGLGLSGERSGGDADGQQGNSQKLLGHFRPLPMKAPHGAIGTEMRQRG